MNTRTTKVMSIAVLLLTAPAWAGSPAVQFDTASTVGCRDVTTDAFAKANPRHRLVEARFQISALVTGNQVSNRARYLYQFISPTGSIQIIDFDPKTELACDVAGNIGIEKKNETTKSLGINVSGTFNQLVRGSAGTDLGAKDAARIQYELKPHKSAVLAAGTISRGTGVYFKLRSSAETTLEGARDFKLIMRVRDSWRGDVIYLRCEARQSRRDSTASFGNTRFVIGLCAEGDDEAMVAAEQLVRTEAVLRRTVARHGRDIQHRSLPTVVHRVGAMLDMYQPRIPESWLDELIYGGTTLDRHAFARYLPKEILGVARAYTHARQKMYRLSGGRKTLVAVAAPRRS